MARFFSRVVVAILLLGGLSEPVWAGALSAEGEFFGGEARGMIEEIESVIEYGRFEIALSLSENPAESGTSLVEDLAVTLRGGPRVRTLRTVYGVLDFLKLFPEVVETASGRTALRLDGVELVADETLYWKSPEETAGWTNFSEDDDGFDAVHTETLPIEAELPWNQTTEIRIHLTVLEEEDPASPPLRELGRAGRLTVVWNPVTGILRCVPRTAPPRYSAIVDPYDVLPDLEITPMSLVATPRRPRPGGAFVLSSSAANRGGETAPLVTVLLESPLGEKRELTIENLRPGEYRSLTWEEVLPLDGGAYRVMLDPFNAVEEADESNNAAVIQIEPLLLPDLAFESPPELAGYGCEGETVAVEAVIVNRGRAPATGGRITAVMRRGETRFQEHRLAIPPLGPGESTAVEFSDLLLPSAGPLELVFFLEPNEAEAVPGDNEARLPMNVTAWPAPKIVDLRITPRQNLSAGDLAEVSGTILNPSSRDGRFLVSVLNDATVVRRAELSLSAGSEGVFEAGWLPLGRGLHRFEMTVVPLSPGWLSDTVSTLRMVDVRRVLVEPLPPVDGGETYFYPSAVESSGRLLDEDLYVLKNGAVQEITWQYDLAPLVEEAVSGDTLRLILNPRLSSGNGETEFCFLALRLIGAEERLYELNGLCGRDPVLLEVPESVWRGQEGLRVSSLKEAEGWQVWGPSAPVLEIPLQKKADLEISEPRFSPQTPRRGDTLSISFSVANHTPMGRSVPITLSAGIGGEEEPPLFITLLPDQTREFTYQVPVDHAGGLLEAFFSVETEEGWSLEKDLTASGSVPLYDNQPADLSIEEAFFVDRSWTMAPAVSAGIIVTNNGPGTAYHCKVVWQADGETVLVKDLPAVGPGETRWISEAFPSLDPASAMTAAILDPLRPGERLSPNAVTRSSKQNPNLEFSLALGQYEFFKTTDGKTVLAFAVQNAGEDNAGWQFPVFLLRDGILWDSATVELPPAGEMVIHTFTISDELEAGTSFEIILNPLGRLPEEDLSNNNLRVTLGSYDSMKVIAPFATGEVHPWEARDLLRERSSVERLSRVYDWASWHEAWKELAETHQLDRIQTSLRGMVMGWGASDSHDRRLFRESLTAFSEAQWDFARGLSLEKPVLPVGTTEGDLSRYQEEALDFLHFVEAALVIDYDELAERMDRLSDLAQEVLLGRWEPVEN